MDWTGYQQTIAKLKAALYFLAAVIAFGTLFLPDVRQHVSMAPAIALAIAALPAALMTYALPWPTSRPNRFIIVHAGASAHLAAFLYVTGGSSSPFWPLVMFIVVSAAAYYRDNWPIYVALAMAAGVLLSPIAYDTPAWGAKAVKVAVTLIALVVARRMFQTMVCCALRSQQMVQTRSAFLLALSHQVTTPLTSLQLGIGAAKESLASESEGARSAAALQVAEKSVNQLSRTVEEVSELFQIATEGTVLELEDVDVVSEAQDLTESFRMELTQKWLQIAVHSDAPIVCVSADRRLLRLTLSNLLKNAIEFTPPGGRVAVNIAEEGGQVRIAVEDSGEGIPEALRVQLFQPYVSGFHARLPDQRMMKGGLGLGLMTAKVIVEDHGGSIRAKKSKLGGTAIELMFDRASHGTSGETGWRSTA